VRYNAAYLYDSLIKVPEFEHWELLADEVSFTSRKSPRIQMADLVAREVMNWRRSIALNDGTTRTACLASLVDHRRLYWHLYERDYFEARVALVQKIVDQGHPIGTYEQWRKEQNCQDTVENRLRFQIKIDKLAREQRPENPSSQT